MKCLNTGPSALPYEYCTGSTGKQVPSASEPPTACEGSSQIKRGDQQDAVYHWLSLAAGSSSLPVHILTSFLQIPSARAYTSAQPRSPFIWSCLSGWLKVCFFLKFFCIRLMKKKRNLKTILFLRFTLAGSLPALDRRLELMIWRSSLTNDSIILLFLWCSTHSFWHQDKCWQISRSPGGTGHVQSNSGCLLVWMRGGWGGGSFFWTPALCSLSCSLNSAPQYLAHLCSLGCSEN